MNYSANQVFSQFGLYAFEIALVGSLSSKRISWLSQESPSLPVSILQVLRQLSREGQRSFLLAIRHHVAASEFSCQLMDHSKGLEVHWRTEPGGSRIQGVCRITQHSEEFSSTTAVATSQSLAKERVQGYRPEFVHREFTQRLVQFSLAMESADLGFWDLNVQTGVLGVNSIFANWFGLMHTKITNINTVLDRVHPDDRESLEMGLKTFRNSTKLKFNHRFRLKLNDQSYHSLELRAVFQVRFDSLHNKVIHMIGMLSDRTLLERAYQQLQESASRAQNESVLKTRFLASVSHELITPIHGVANLLRLINVSHIPSDEAKLLAQAKEQLHSLDEFLDTVREFADLQAYDSVATPAPCNIVGLIRSVCESYREQFEQKSLSFTVTLPDMVVRQHWVDASKLIRIVDAALSNALKFTKEGEVKVSLSISEASAPAMPCGHFDDIVVEVQDTGRGMSQENLAQVFDPYFQQSESQARLSTGLGIGLSVSRRYADLIGADLAIESQPGKGVRFVLRWTATRVDCEMQNSSAKSADPYSDSLKSVLVVDDVALNRIVLRVAFEKDKVKVFEAENGVDALTLFRDPEFKPDLVLMDVQMPEMDGVECTQYLKSSLGLRVPVIGLTADVTPQTRQDCLRAGMDDVLYKPIDTHELVQRVRSGTRTTIN